MTLTTSESVNSHHTDIFLFMVIYLLHVMLRCSKNLFLDASTQQIFRTYSILSDLQQIGIIFSMKKQQQFFFSCHIKIQFSAIFLSPKPFLLFESLVPTTSYHKNSQLPAQQVVHFGHPILGTYEVIQFLDLANLEGTHCGVVYETHTYSMVFWDGNIILFPSLSNTMPLHTIPLAW